MRALHQGSLIVTHGVGIPDFKKETIKPLSSGGSKAVDLNTHNGFGIVVQDLTLSRLDNVHTVSTSIFNTEISAWCREKGQLFHDPEQITLALQPPPTLSTLTLSVKLPPEILEQIKSDEAVIQERNSAKGVELTDVISAIQLWRRLSKCLAQPVLFGEGNSLLRSKPHCAHVVSHAVHTLPKFEKSLFHDSWFKLAVSLMVTGLEKGHRRVSSCIAAS